jgi:hypothetical protein
MTDAAGWIEDRECWHCQQMKPGDDFPSFPGWKPRGWCTACLGLLLKVGRASVQYRLWLSARRRAHSKGWEFDLLITDIVLPQFCPYFRTVRINYGPEADRDAGDSPSLDRIDSSLGYVRGNVRIISLRANRMKSDSTVEELQEFAEGIAVVHPREPHVEPEPPPCNTARRKRRRPAPTTHPALRPGSSMYRLRNLALVSPDYTVTLREVQRALRLGDKVATLALLQRAVESGIGSVVTVVHPSNKRRVHAFRLFFQPGPDTPAEASETQQCQPTSGQCHDEPADVQLLSEQSLA